ncbi:unannotated protein [freshwater metagenome]|uniref:Unannotated protein n=1 Tax=freshwater metagenome TaxID=449393 RepID=A0A6J6LP68_9ZZZZ|nr:hypothetical protein [Actinomycetota bacterium]MSY38535.1 hypothetical protein [Actinomycetota bacterium]
MIKKISRKKKFSSGAFSAVAVTTAAALVLTLAPADAAPTKVLPAPGLPTPQLVSKYVIRKNIVSVPAAGNLGTGAFVVGSSPNMRAASIHSTAATSSGTPLMADWNGDGIATPGRYDSEVWYATDTVIGKTPAWKAVASFAGQPGDIPLVGNLTKDRIPDVGFFRNGTWLWQLNGDKAQTVQFGTQGDKPVVGDWNGDGVDDLGVVHVDGTWTLKVPGVTKKKDIALDPGATLEIHKDENYALVNFAFGLSTDIPVVGDWNADGSDSPGVVRNNTTWIFSKSLKKLMKTSKVEFPVASGFTALVGTRATGIESCPTATPTSEKRALELAAKVVPPAKLKGNVKQQGMPEILATVQDGLRYAITNDLTKRLNTQVAYPYYDVLNVHKTIEESVRRSANVALAGAIMLSTTNWKKVQNITRAQLMAYTKWQIRSIACQHNALTPGGWGTTWQSALWATTTAQAAWMIWPSLSRQEKAYVAAMIDHEADAVAARGPHYYKNRDGVEYSKGNSKSDEVSWDLTSLALAQAMMPSSKKQETWRKALIGFSIAAFARPSDLKNNDVVNGINISKELPGTNANEDGTITNHNIINPDYQQNVQNLWWAASMLRVAKQPVPEAVFLNADIIYRSLAVVDFPSPPYAAPGGIVYKPGGQIYYPQGVSWGTRRPATFTGVDSFAAIYSAPDTNAAQYLADHARDTRGMQLRYDSGKIYATGNAEDSYALGKEEYALQQTALAWWAGAVPSGPGFKLDKSKVTGVNLNPTGAVA